jgi:uncharacterized protein YcfJ
MFSKVVTSGVVAICVLAAPAAFADQSDSDWQNDNNDDVRVGPTYEYARVISSDPIVRQVRIETPRRECWTDDSYNDRRTVQSERPDSAGRMILGGLIGAAIGNQFGHGDGRRAATVAGALIGTAIGHDAGSRPYDRYGSRPYDRYGSRSYDSRPVERCNVRYESTYENRIDGYNVTYEYAGQRHTTRMSYDPGDRIRIRVDVRPVD